MKNIIVIRIMFFQLNDSLQSKNIFVILWLDYFKFLLKKPWKQK